MTGFQTKICVCGPSAGWEKGMVKDMEQLQAYTILEKKEIKELNSTGYLIRHDKTGAKVVLIDRKSVV